MGRENNKAFEITRRDGTTYIRVPLLLGASLLVVLALLSLLLWSAKWKRDPSALTVRDPGDLQAMLPSMAGVTQGDLDRGNRVEVLQNGDGFFPRLFADIAAARESVHIETFIWWDGELARRLAALLAQKAREGVEVRLLVDASGGRQVRKVEQQLRDSGVLVAKFHPIRLSNLGRVNNRDHRKLMIIDGRIGYVAGHGIGDEWMGNAGNKAQYRDTALRIEGPVVRRLQGAFSENWIEETGDHGR